MNNPSEPPKPMHAPGVREEMPIKRERQRRDDRPVIGASPWRYRSLRCEPATKHGQGIVGDCGERREPHPV